MTMGNSSTSISTIAVFLAFSFVVKLPAIKEHNERQPGQWSLSAIDLCAGEKGTIPEEARDLSVYSPDRSKVLRVAKSRWWLMAGEKRLSPEVKQARIGCPAEIAWSPNSSAFYITQSDGSIAGFHTEVYLVGQERLEQTPNVNLTIEQDMNRSHKCVQHIKGEAHEEARNIAGVMWSKDSKQLLLAAEIRPDSACGPSGYFVGYLVAVPEGKVLQRYSPADVHTDWAEQLGERLKGDFTDLTSEERKTQP